MVRGHFHTPHHARPYSMLRLMGSGLGLWRRLSSLGLQVKARANRIRLIGVCRFRLVVLIPADHKVSQLLKSNQNFGSLVYPGCESEGAVSNRVTDQILLALQRRTDHWPLASCASALARPDG